MSRVADMRPVARPAATQPRGRRRAAAVVPFAHFMAAILCLLVALTGCARDDATPGARGAGPPAPADAAARAPADPAAGTRGNPLPPVAPPAVAAAVAAAAGSENAAAADGPRVALVIDDLGQRLGGPDAALLALPVPLTLAVLPGHPHSRAIAAQATAPGAAGDAGRRELFLHLPMEPEDYPRRDPGPDALLRGQSSAQVAGILDRALASVPGAVGVNNHMGSAATADSLLMSVLMATLAERGLRFLDSLTTSRSVAWQAARRAGVPAARSRLFLDAEPADEASVAARLGELVATARRSGAAIGIAHPHAATAAALTREIPRHLAEGVRFVTVSQLMPPLVATAGAGQDDHGR